MVALEWDKVGQRRYETGVDRGVLYHPNASGVYDKGYAWNGLVTVTESPSGAEKSPQYADNIKYVELVSAEEFGGTIEAFTYPDAFGLNNGEVLVADGVTVGQQARLGFGLCYRTKIGNDLNPDAGYKLHLVYGALASPSEKGYTTVNDSPEAMTLSWEFTTTGVQVANRRPVSSLVVDSTKTPAAKLASLETLLYGAASTEPKLPTPAEVITLIGTAA